ncbi:MAG TPA: carbohydrate-binding protein [Rariglobus sp.]|nr:carbohydrate-binding protein [Rariglobus sp.]
MPTTQYSSPELEASGHAYVRLAATGQYVEWTNNTGKNINGINVRASIPDSATGGGITATLDIYVNGAFRQALTLNSKQSWLYEGGTNNYNGNNQNPADGNPRVFFDEMHTTITGAAIAPGSTIRLQKNAANTAAFYHIDVVDLEALPAALSQPANSLSITSYGAVSYNTGFDNSTAIQNCINAAKSQGKSVWIPQGVFYFKSLGGFTATGVTIQGAGMWYSTIYRNLPLPNSTPLGAVFNITSCTLRNFAIDTNATSRASVDGCGGGMDTSGTNWLTENIWVQHTMSGLWASGNGGTVRNCRLTSIWADGINLNNVSLNAGIGTNLTSTNNFIRGTGDDAHAINSVDYNDFGSGRTYYTRMSNITVTNNTSIAMWGGKGQAIYGGLNQVVKDNYMSDTARYVGLGVGKFNANGSNLESATVTGNVVVRCGGNAYLQQQPAMMIGNGGDGQGTGTVSNVFAGGNTITNAQYDAMAISSSSNIVVQYNTINSPRFDGIVISPPNYDALTGSGMFRQNTVTGLSTGAMVLVNESNGYTVISPLAAASYNSMLGVTAETCAEGGQDLGYINGSDWTAYNNMNLTGVTKFAARIASAGSGGNIEVRLDSPTGTLVGTCTVPVTGGWQTYQNVYCNVSGVSGTRNVYLVYTGGSGFLFNIQCFALYTETIRRLVPGKTVTLNAAVNNLYVCADSAGTKPLIANRTSGGLWESYLVVDAGNGNIALRALANNLYVCADSAGASPLIANRTSYGAWETFREVDAGSGKIAIRALNNNQYVSAPNAGTSPLVASQTSIGLAESFTVGVR